MFIRKVSVFLHATFHTQARYHTLELIHNLKTHLILLFVLFNLSLFSQSNNLEGIKIVYKIDIDGFQKIKLQKNKNNKYKGVLINHIYKLGFLRRKITEIQKIEKNTVKKLMKKIDEIGVNSIDKINCWSLLKNGRSEESLKEFVKCQDSTTTCLDGDGTSFKIRNNNSIRQFDFECLSFNEEIKPKTSQNRIKAIEILKAINYEINLKKSFEEFISNLKKGDYIYYGVNILSKG